MSDRAGELLAECSRWYAVTPKIQYGTQFDRFGLHVPPNPRHADCSGSVHTWCAHVHVQVGLDTADLWKDVARGLAVRVDPRLAAPGDVLLHRSHPGVYRAGPTEHTSIKVRNEGDRIRSWESAGSGEGITYASRPADFWQDALHYHAIDQPGITPTAKPAPVPIPEDADMPALVMDDQNPHVWITSGTERVWLQTDVNVKGWAAPRPRIVVGVDDKGNVARVPKAALDVVPVKKGTAVPPAPYKVSVWTQ